MDDEEGEVDETIGGVTVELSEAEFEEGRTSLLGSSLLHNLKINIQIITLSYPL